MLCLCMLKQILLSPLTSWSMSLFLLGLGPHLQLFHDPTYVIGFKAHSLVSVYSFHEILVSNNDDNSPSF